MTDLHFGKTFNPKPTDFVTLNAAIMTNQLNETFNTIRKLKTNYQTLKEAHNMSTNKAINRLTSLVQTLTKKCQNLEKALECQICMDNPKDITFECGHPICATCLPLLQKCPSCESSNLTPIKLFL